MRASNFCIQNLLFLSLFLLVLEIFCRYNMTFKREILGDDNTGHPPPPPPPHLRYGGGGYISPIPRDIHGCYVVALLFTTLNFRQRLKDASANHVRMTVCATTKPTIPIDVFVHQVSGGLIAKTVRKAIFLPFDLVQIQTDGLDKKKMTIRNHCVLSQVYNP